jgi:hypothetical protein
MTKTTDFSKIEETLLKEADDIGLEPEEQISASPSPVVQPQPPVSAETAPAIVAPASIPPAVSAPAEKTILQTLADIFKAPAGMKFDTAISVSPFSVTMTGVNGDVRLIYNISVQTSDLGTIPPFINVSCWCDRPSHFPDTASVNGQFPAQQAVSASRSYICDVNIPLDQFIMGTFNTTAVQQSVQEKISSPDFNKIYVS